MRYLRIALALAAVGAWAAGPLVARAGAGERAPEYVSSEPEKGAMMDEPPSEVRVTFSEPLDPSSVMNVADECGNEIDSGPATVRLNEMTVGIGKTPSGMYEVVYRAVGIGGVTGETASSFEFMVHDGKACDGGPGDHDDHDDEDDDHGGHGKGDGNGHGGHGDDDMGDHGGHSSSGSMHSGGHTSTGHSGPTRHGDGHGKHGDHRDGPRNRGSGGAEETPPFANALGGPGPIRADAEAMLIGLGLALVVGALGGWLLRTTGKLAGV